MTKRNVIRARATDEGLVIPKGMLPGAREFEIRAEDDRLVIVPVPPGEDPILGLGRDPVTLGLTDAATNHDLYLYGNQG